MACPYDDAAASIVKPLYFKLQQGAAAIFFEILFQSKPQFRAPTGRDSNQSGGVRLSTLQYCRVNTERL